MPRKRTEPMEPEVLEGPIPEPETINTPATVEQEPCRGLLPQLMTRMQEDITARTEIFRDRFDSLIEKLDQTNAMLEQANALAQRQQEQAETFLKLKGLHMSTGGRQERPDRAN